MTIYFKQPEPETPTRWLYTPGTRVIWVSCLDESPAPITVHVAEKPRRTIIESRESRRYAPMLRIPVAFA